MFQTLAVELVKLTDAMKPSEGPIRQVRPTFADLDEIAPNVRPTKGQLDRAHFHLRHGLVGRITVDHQHAYRVRGKVPLGHIVAARGVEAINDRVFA